MHFYFIGVTTSHSAMVRIMPLWSEVLGTNLDLMGVDLPIDAGPQEYQNAVLELKKDPKAIGSVVTTHKVKIFEHASKLFDEFDSLTELTKEICTIAKRGSRLAGFAVTDCVSAGRVLSTMLGANHWDKHDSDVVCFGAGGFARAIALSLLFDFDHNNPFEKKRQFKPRRLFLIDIDERQLQSMRELLQPLQGDMHISYLCHSKAEENDRLLADALPRSLVINATGMGKDRPGSPLTDQALFPLESIVWDLNYRGERRFLEQARSQKDQQKLQIHDGWDCFVRGWSQALEVALEQKFSPSQLQELARVAEPFRTG